MGNFARGLFIGCWKSEEEWFWPFKPFSNLKTTFCEYWTSIKIKISMTCMYRVQSQNKNGTGAMNKPKNEAVTGI